MSSSYSITWNTQGGVSFQVSADITYSGLLLLVKELGPAKYIISPRIFDRVDYIRLVNVLDPKGEFTEEEVNRSLGKFKENLSPWAPSARGKEVYLENLLAKVMGIEHVKL